MTTRPVNQQKAGSWHSVSLISHFSDNAKLLENVKVTQDGELVEIAVEHERCPSE